MQLSIDLFKFKYYLTVNINHIFYLKNSEWTVIWTRQSNKHEMEITDGHWMILKKKRINIKILGDKFLGKNAC